MAQTPKKRFATRTCRRRNFKTAERKGLKKYSTSNKKMQLTEP